MHYAKKISILVLFTLLTIAGAQVKLKLPGTAVPFTLQSLAVVLAGLFSSWPLAVGSQLLYLLAGLFLPVFAGSTYGPEFYGSPTAAYVFAFTPAAALLAYYRQRSSSLLFLFLLTLCAHLFILLCGSSWIMQQQGFSKAVLEQTFILLLPGAMLKSTLVTLLLALVKKLRLSSFMS